MPFGSAMNAGHQDANQNFSITGVIGSAGTADVGGTALTLPIGVREDSGAMYVYNLGPAGSVTLGNTPGGTLDRIGSIDIIGTMPAISVTANPTSGTLNTLGTVGTILGIGGTVQVSGASAGTNVNIVSGTQETLGTVGTVLGVGGTSFVHVTNTGTDPVPVSPPASGYLVVRPEAGTQNTLGTVGTVIGIGTISNVVTTSGTVTGIGTISNNVTIVGTSSNNNSAPTTNNLGVLSAVANADVSVLTEGKQTLLSTDISGYLRTKSNSESALGDLTTVSRRNQIDINFSNADGLDATLITNSASGSGTYVQANGEMTYSTGTTATGRATGVSIGTIVYRPSSEIFSYFTTSFTAPTDAVGSNYQRMGLYNGTNGFSIGYEGTTFGLTWWQNGTQNRIAKSSFNIDTLSGTNTRFTTGGTQQALDPTKWNLYRIRFSWFGASPIHFEALSPDSEWVPFHTIRYPNAFTDPSIYSTGIPMTVDVFKGTSDATNLSVDVGCWAAGVADSAQRITDSFQDSTLVIPVRAIIAGHSTSGTVPYINVKVAPSGAIQVGGAVTADITSGTQQTLGTVGVVNNLVTGTVASVGSVVGIGTVSNTVTTSGTVTGVGVVSNVTTGTLASVASVGTVPGVGTISNLGSITNIGTLPVVSLGSSGTVLNLASGTLAAVTSVTNLVSGTLAAVTSVTNLAAGTVSAVNNVVTGTLANVTLNPKQTGSAILTTHTLGTAGGTTLGTLIAPVGAGTYVYVTGLSMVARSGTPDIAIMTNVAGSTGAGVFARGVFVPSGGIARQYYAPIQVGTNGTIAYMVINGTADFTLDYWVGT